jgi:hypothetical protein
MKLVTGLIHFNRAGQELLKAKTIDVVIAIRNAAAEIKLRAERRAGEMLKEGKEKGQRDAGRGGDRKSQSQDADHEHATVKPATLEEIGINKSQSSRWQAIAAIPEVQFEQIIREAKEANREPTQRALLKVARESEQSGERRNQSLTVRKKSVPNQEALFDLNDLSDYQRAIDHYVSIVIRLRNQAFKKYRVQIPVQIPLPFEEDSDR